MERQRQLHPAERMPKAAAVLLAVDLLDTLLLQPEADFVIRDRRAAGTARDGNGVADVIAVAVRDENEVGRHRVRFLCCRGVAGQERIDEDVTAVALEQQTGVAQPADASGHGGSFPSRGGVRDVFPVPLYFSRAYAYCLVGRICKPSGRIANLLYQFPARRPRGRERMGSMGTTETPRPVPRGAYWTLAALFGMNLLNFVDRYILASVLEPIKQAPPVG